ncbi:hypothetical protein [Xenophilus sp. Marseille-Q4582]|uniref:hypothetical protein n=1 Tax=Xenophilus sp. Marseille-Q4582 TaxID=2866600 RepID=UPI001CE471CD|nr:hypothetical protein [Xenophilus sp. Marseille-Q4582]
MTSTFRTAAQPLWRAVARRLWGGEAADATVGACTLSRLAWTPDASGHAVLRMAELELHDVRLRGPGFVLRAELIRIEGLQVRPFAMQAAHAGAWLQADRVVLTQACAQAELAPPAVSAPLPPARGDWQLEPLGAATGELTGRITDAHLFFDATVRVGLRDGRIDFNDATVAHVGPDSRMGVARMGLYVDAPHGRSYLYQFASPPLAGVDYERRGALLNSWVSDRGRIWLQPLAEALLRQSLGGLAQGLTEQARLLLQRTSLRGHLQLGEGWVKLPGLSLRLSGRADGANSLRLQAQEVGEGASVHFGRLQAQDLCATAAGQSVHLDRLQARGQLALRLPAMPGQLELRLEACELTQLRLNGAPA